VSKDEVGKTIVSALFIRKSERILLSSPARHRVRYSSGVADAGPPKKSARTGKIRKDFT